MALRVGFDATSAARQSAGIGRYTRELLAALSARPDDVSYGVFWCARGELHGHLPVLDARFRRHPLPVSDRVLNALWHRLRLPVPVELVIGRFDVFHSPDFTLPPTLGRPTVLTVHDLAFLRAPECAYPSLRTYLATVVPRSVRSASAVIAVSERTRRDLIELFDVSPDKVTTVPEAVSAEFYRVENGDEARSEVNRLGIRMPYILSVGTLEPRKNFVRLLEAYSLLRERGVEHQLVVAGGPGWMYEPIFRRLAELRLEDHVVFVRPTDGELRSLYAASDAAVFASLYEGFGIPPLEALTCGVPVAASSAASLPEVIGDAGLLFDPLSVEGMADAVWTLLDDSELRTELQRRGPIQAARFSWARTAEETVRVYHKVADRA
jgi:glycosyltransferase involved in cell wall biosynthesis